MIIFGRPCCPQNEATWGFVARFLGNSIEGGAQGRSQQTRKVRVQGELLVPEGARRARA